MDGKFLLLITLTVLLVDCRKHHLALENDGRRLIHITTFGFYKGGTLEVTLHNFYTIPPMGNSELPPDQPVGFTVDRTLNDGINPYSHNLESSCSVISSNLEDESFSSLRFFMDFKNNVTKIQWSTELQSHVKVYKSRKCVPLFSKTWPTNKRMPLGNSMTQRQRRSVIPESDKDPIVQPNSEIQQKSSTPLPKEKSVPEHSNESVEKVNPVDLDQSSVKKSSDTKSKGVDLLSNEAQGFSDLDSAGDPIFVDPASEGSRCEKESLQLNVTQLADGTLSYSMTFVVYIAGEDCEGLYNLYFHNCAKAATSRVTLNMTIVEENQDAEGKNYLSAGEMPLPALYFMMSVLFFTAGCFWVVILRKSKRETGVSVFKIHYLMAALVFLKSLSLLFHSINYHFIQIVGTHVEGWAMLFYVTHLLKGALLFITILLIGTGYAFVKHLLNDKDKKVFMIVIPLQVLANVAQIILEESEEGEVVHTTWKFIFISVDLLCCGAILFPVVWSIRHLQEASQTDGKAAMNLRKLKLFRHFYIMVVCYIYFTRIIVQMLLRITVPFQYEFLDDMFREMTTFIFFVLTGYKFRPAANNPYLELAHDSDEEDMNIALTESGLTEGVSKRGFKAKKKTLKEIVLFDPNEEGSDDDEEVLLEKREASHDFD